MPGPAFLHGDTVTLRPVERDDLSFLQTNINDPTVWRSLAMNAPINGRQEEEWFESIGDGDGVHLLITDGERRVGVVSLMNVDTGFGVAELGYWVTPDEQRRGYASDAVGTATTYAFDHRRLHRVSAQVLDFNEASQRLLESLGFREEGILRERMYVDGAYRDLHVFGVLEDEWDGT